MDDYSIMDNARAVISEHVPETVLLQDQLPGVECGHSDPAYWTTDDAGSWLHEGGAGAGAGRQLETYEVSMDPADKGNGKIYVDPDGVAYGPIYGGKLEVSVA
jgi:hypothetical protein